MEWIKLEDEYPINMQIVLVCDVYNNFVSLGRYIEEDECDYHFELMNIDNVEIDSNITHWMPLPEIPRDGDLNE